MSEIIKGACGLPRGFYATGISTSIKKTGEKDLGLIYSKRECHAAAMFTTNKVKAAPVKLSMERMDNPIHAIIVNSGNANACTGEKGMQDALTMTRIVEENFELPKGSVLVCSTGVIGVNLPMQSVEFGVNKICKNLFKPHQANDEFFSDAIMTTDKRRKEIGLRVKIGTEFIKFGASAKGAGMIAPHLATLLAFVTTDAHIAKDALRSALKAAVEDSFNCISIDGDMSTNDTIMVLANGAVENPEIQLGTPEYDIFETTLKEICLQLAKEIVKDGEGASKFINFTVKGAASQEDAKNIAFGVANSLLFKTACFGMDPNWGRILAAAGSVEKVKFDPDKVTLHIGEHLTVENGNISPSYNEPEVARYLKKKEISFILNLNLGKHEKTVYTTDISFEYVRVNSSYKT